MASNERAKVGVLVGAGALVVIAAGGAWLATRPSTRPGKLRVDRAASEGSMAVTPAVAIPQGASNEDPGGGSHAQPRLDRARADAMRERLHAIFSDAGLAWGGAPIAEPAATPSATASPEYRTMPMPGGEGMDAPLAKYIKERMHDDFFPLAKQCYLNAMAKNPSLKGRFVLKYKIVGDKRVGGVVDSVEAGEKSDMNDPAFSQCMTESMMSVSFDAPPDGRGHVSVEYPIEFSPDDEDAG